MDYQVPAQPDDNFAPDLPGMGGDDKEAVRLKRLVSKIRKDLENRSNWETRQAGWQRMRTVGIGRASLPFKGAADFHFPLADTFIEKLKPFYYQQTLQPFPICSFVPKDSDSRALSNIASQWFDYHVRTKSNFRKALPVLIDQMLERSKSVLKITWGHDESCLKYEAVDPVDIIVPSSTEALEDSERVTHVIYLSREDYLRRAQEAGNWNTDPGWIKSACGKDDDEFQVYQDKDFLTGVDSDDDDGLMTLWEVYSRGKDGKIVVDLINPSRSDKPARPSVSSFPYRHGKLPFVDFNYEIKSRGYYDNRGVPEIIGQFEMELCKLENEKLDFMTFCNRPIFTHKGATFNVQNLRLAPGQVFGSELSVVEMPKPPVSFEEESQNIRSIAENRIGMPDFGIGRSSDFRQPRTAKEAEMLQQVNNQGVDLRARVFHSSLGEVYGQSWSLLLQYAINDLDFTYRSEYNQIDPKALRDAYILEPNGNADGYDSNAEINKLVNIINLPIVSKFLDPEKTAKALLELADARYMRELFMPGATNQSQYQLQASEVGDMLNGFPIQVNPDDDHGQHCKALLQYFQFCDQNGVQVPILPSFLLYNHFIQHYQAYAQTNKEGFKADKQILDNAKGRIEQALPILQQALNDGLPPMASLAQVQAHLKQINQQLQPSQVGPLSGQTGQPMATPPPSSGPTPPGSPSLSGGGLPNQAPAASPQS